jgi:hypothetical protein
MPDDPYQPGCLPELYLRQCREAKQIAVRAGQCRETG